MKSLPPIIGEKKKGPLEKSNVKPQWAGPDQVFDRETVGQVLKEQMGALTSSAALP